MNQLQEQFDQASIVLNEILGKTKKGLFLSQEDQAALHNAVDTLYREQARIQALLEGDAESVSSIQEANLLLTQRKEKEQQYRQLRQLAANFPSVCVAKT